MYVLYSFLLLFGAVGMYSYELTDITGKICHVKVFGNNSGVIPAAFGDFNGDKLTDMIVLKSNPNDDILSLRLLLANEQKVVTSASSSDPLFHWGTRDENLQCNFLKGSLTSAVPGDFDGDGGMDILITSNIGGKLEGSVLWGYHTDTVHQLLCKEDQDPAWVRTFPLLQEPLVFDYNFDYISDLLLVTEDGNRTIYIFSENRTDDYTVKTLKSPRTDELKATHSNAHLDMNEDGLADLLLTTQSGLEIYRRVGNALEDNFEYHLHVPWPDEVISGPCTVDECVGQAVFADFDLSGSLDLIIPICFDTLCKSSNMFLIPLSDLWTATGWTWIPMSMDLGSLHFYPPGAKTNLLQLMAPRIGDVDLDGFPDLLMPLRNISSQPETHLLMNIPCGAYTTCQPYWREFQLRPAFTEGTGNTVMATFFDLFEDGRPDILSVTGNPENGFKLAAYTNTSQDSDAYFVKVVVLSGACFHNCRNKSSKFVPYGTNSGGQVVSYRSQRVGPETFDYFQSTAAQLPQSAYFSLQTPYTIFGLGLAPNFVDYLWVNISAMTHSWPQIIPNSQLYIIPYPRNKAELWQAKISIFPSKSIVITGLSMIGTCAFTALLILILHIRERRQDHHAKLQESNRFHFDAM